MFLSLKNFSVREHIKGKQIILQVANSYGKQHASGICKSDDGIRCRVNVIVLRKPTHGHDREAWNKVLVC